MKKYDLDDPLVWKSITSEKLKSHIFNGHIRRPYVLRRFGIPTFDVELAAYRYFNFAERDFDLTDIGRNSLEAVVNFDDNELLKFNLNPEEISNKYLISDYRRDILNSVRYMRNKNLTPNFTKGELGILDIFFSQIPFEFGGYIRDVEFKPKYSSFEISHYEELALKYDDFLEDRGNITTICGSKK